MLMYVCASVCVCVCVCVCVHAYAPRIVSMDKILCFTNSLIIINIMNFQNSKTLARKDTALPGKRHLSFPKHSQFFKDPTNPVKHYSCKVHVCSELN